ncbi:type I 3-dehydroquinate dehydratase [Cellulomonas shaoxiangyii]|uniref:3-dehydroquinate dehydratase n=1 Tax=Cellulomonas shaoxiangyii TaxID=2566013 RepID=A0A4P7SN42_9CELL|nr:type I 3-dehydroquinate dehydratase [Cellulomonas shaoxiangyii]QCB94947.1 type I 3-dehydroquinate dehydratase [Cellulomonas shaoxiangyii]TGY84455.1 type I 3-dehydroquinate dehydratase [Cellulomonas shaoxiangyii]
MAGSTPARPAAPDTGSPSARLVRLRGTTLGTGVPAVCVPLVATTPERAAADARALPPGAADVVEVRLDHVAGSAADPALVTATLRAVRAALPDDVPVLATFRSAREGGVQPADDAAYAAVVRAAVRAAVDAGAADAVDVELATPDALRDDLLAGARAHGLPVVVSTHDFTGTPPHDALVDVLRRQRDVGADVCKVAVTPADADDVLTLLRATRTFAREADRPVVTIAMGGLGLVTRLAGEVFGSALTFGSVGAASAPGQLDAVRLREVLALVHDAL